MGAGSPTDDPTAEARALLLSGDASGALRAADRASLDPDTAADGFTLRARALRHLGRAGDALIAAQAALARSPGFAAARLEQASSLRALGRSADALAVARALTAERSDLAAAWRLRGQLAIDLDELDEAARASGEALAAEPEHPDLAVLQARLAARRRDSIGEIRALVRSLDLNPGSQRLQRQLVHAVDWGPGAVARGLWDLSRVVTIFAALACARLIWEGQWVGGVTCVAGTVFGLFGPALLLRQALRLRLADDAPGAWAYYQNARRRRDGGPASSARSDS